jgi:hypothetical protein
VTEKHNHETGVLLKLLVKVTPSHHTKDFCITRCHVERNWWFESSGMWHYFIWWIVPVPWRIIVPSVSFFLDWYILTELHAHDTPAHPRRLESTATVLWGCHITCAKLLLCRVRGTKEACLWDCLLFWVIYSTVTVYNCNVSTVELNVVEPVCECGCQLVVRWPSSGEEIQRYYDVWWCCKLLELSYINKYGSEIHCACCFL